MDTKIPEVKMPHSLTSSFDKMPEPFGIKNLESRYVYTNQAVIDIYGLKNKADVIGKTEYEIKSRLSESDDSSKEFVRQDRQVSNSGNSLLSLEIHPLAVDYPYIVNKIPYMNDDDECVGVLAYSRKLEVYSLNDYVKGHMPGSLLLNKPDNFYTERECEIMFFRLQGMKIKEVAERLNLATRTVENYMQELYFKANVNHFDDFKEFCEKRSYHRYLPKRFLQVSHIDFMS